MLKTFADANTKHALLTMTWGEYADSKRAEGMMALKPITVDGLKAELATHGDFDYNNFLLSDVVNELVAFPSITEVYVGYEYSPVMYLPLNVDTRDFPEFTSDEHDPFEDADGNLWLRLWWD